MSNILITPLMGLPNPIPGVDPGPDYATNLYNSLNILDGHNHSAGSGNQVTPDGILINTDLPFNGNDATLLRSVRFSTQGSPIAEATDLGCLYESGVDLYYNDGSGNQVRITSGGSVNATSSGISSGTATAAFSGGVLVVNQAANTPGNIQCGSVLIGNNTVGTNFVTIEAPSSLAANYNFILPTALPGARSFMTIDSSGNLASGVAYTNGITSSQIASGTITGTNIASNTVSRTNLTAVGQQISSSSGSFATSSTSYVDVTNLTVTLTTTGRPVLVMLQALLGNHESSVGTLGTGYAQIRFVEGAASIGEYSVGGSSAGALNTTGFFVLDPVSAGTTTWKVQAKQNGTGAVNAVVTNMVLVAWEL